MSWDLNKTQWLQFGMLCERYYRENERKLDRILLEFVWLVTCVAILASVVLLLTERLIPSHYGGFSGFSATAGYLLGAITAMLLWLAAILAVNYATKWRNA